MWPSRVLRERQQGNNIHDIYLQASTSWPSPISHHRLEVWLKGYDVFDKNQLISGISKGFIIQSSPPARDLQGYTNHRSALQFADQLEVKIQQELSLNRIAGPFTSPPPGLIVSPLAAVPKRGSSEIRLIHDLSFPKGVSVNDFIPRELCTVSYELIDECIDLIVSIGQGCLIAKADVAHAFRIIPIHPTSYHLLGFSWNNQYYFDKSLAMGCSSSCNIFEKLSNAVQWIMLNKFKITHMSHILDDFMFFGPPSSNKCAKALFSFLQFAESVGIPIKSQKTVHPTPVAELHGLLVNTTSMQISLPDDKLVKARSIVTSLQRKKYTTLRELQSVLGLLNFCCRVIKPGRPFLRRLTDLTKGATNPNHHIRLNKQARADLSCWSLFLESYNGVQMLEKVPWNSSNSWKFFSDSSFLACAATFADKWIQVPFPPSWRQVHIAPKELLPIMLAFRMWAPLIKKSNILFLVDNISVVHVINNKTSKDPLMITMIRQMMVTALFNNMEFAAKHIPGKHNVIPDLLSRLQDSRARQMAPWLRQSPEHVPQDWLPW